MTCGVAECMQRHAKSVRACVVASLVCVHGYKYPSHVLIEVRWYEPSLGARDDVVSAGTVVCARSAVRELLWVGCGVLPRPGFVPSKVRLFVRPRRRSCGGAYVRRKYLCPFPSIYVRASVRER